MREIAALADVSVGTVSNALNHPNKVSAKTLKKVREAASALGFKAKSIASHSSSQSKFVGIVLPLSGNSFFDEFTIGFEDEISKSGLVTLVAYSREDVESEIKIVSSMTEADFLGVIVVPGVSAINSFQKFNNQRYRFAYISQTEETPDHCSLSIDQLRGGFIGLQYLQRLGHKNVLWVSGPDKHYPSLQRLIGMTQAAKDMGVALTVKQALSLDHQTGLHIAEEIIAAGQLPDAIFAVNDVIAMAIISHFISVGIRVPEDVSVLGYDNISGVELEPIPLSSVSQSPYHLGTIVAQQLITDISAQDDHVHKHVVFHSHVVERASTAAKVSGLNP